MINLLNNNTGVIAIISPLLAYYFGLKTIKTADKKKKKEFKKDLESLLLNELFFNLNYVSRLDITFNKNFLKEDNNLYIPIRAPRTEIIEKYVEYDLISSLDKSKRLEMLNIYAQLNQLKKEYYIWRELIARNPVIKQESLIFEQLSLPMSEITTPLLKNIVNLWITLVMEIGNKSEYSAIKELCLLMKKKKKEGKWLIGFYKASEYYSDTNKDEYDIIICWINDLDDEVNKEIIELRSMLQ